MSNLPDVTEFIKSTGTFPDPPAGYDVTETITPESMINLKNTTPGPMIILPPPPGSQAALDRGCRCPVLDNRSGEGACEINGKVEYWINEDCPLHGGKK